MPAKVRHRSTAKFGGSRSHQYGDYASSALKHLELTKNLKDVKQSAADEQEQLKHLELTKNLKDAKQSAADEQDLVSKIEELLSQEEESHQHFMAREKEAERLGRRNDRMMNWAITNLWGQDKETQADKEMQAKQALQNRSRELALECVWDHRSSGTSAGASIADLAMDWEHTYHAVLTEEQRHIICEEYGQVFVTFLNSGIINRNAPKMDSGARAAKRGFCCEEKAYQMLVIDNIEDKAVREGRRQAYMVAVYGTSQEVTWEEERQRVQDELDAEEP